MGLERYKDYLIHRRMMTTIGYIIVSVICIITGLIFINFNYVYSIFLFIFGILFIFFLVFSISIYNRNIKNITVELDKIFKIKNLLNYKQEKLL